MKARWSRIVLGITLAVMAVAFLVVSRLRPDTSLEALFAQNDPAAASLVRVFNGYRSVEELLILVTSPAAQPHPDKLITFATGLQNAIAQDAEGSRLSAGVLWRTDAQTRDFFQRVLVPGAFFYLDDDAFAAAQMRLSRPEIFKQIQQDRALLATPGPAAQQLSKLIQLDPLRLHELIMDRLTKLRPFKTYQNSDAFLSPDGRSILIRVRGRHPVSDLQFSRDFTTAITRLANQTNADHLELNITGSYAIAAASQAAIRSDMISSVVGSVVFLQLLFLLAYRKPIGSFFLAISPIAVGILVGAAIYAIVKPTFTPISAAIGGILAGMGIDYSIQFLSHYQRRFAQTEASDIASVATLRALWPAMLAAWATSVIGFAAIGSANVQALRDFSLLGALGLTGAFAAALTLLPALLALFSRGHNSKLGMLRPVFTSPKPLQWLAAQRTRLIGIGIFIFLAAGVILMLPGKWITLDLDLSAMNPEPNPPLDAEKMIQQRMGASAEGMICYLRADSPDELVHIAHETGERLRKMPGIGGTFGLDSLLPDPYLSQQRLKQIDPKLADRVVADFNEALHANGFAIPTFAPYANFLRNLINNRTPPDLRMLTQYPSLAETILPANAFDNASQSNSRSHLSPSPGIPGEGRGEGLTSPRTNSHSDKPSALPQHLPTEAVTYIFTTVNSSPSTASIESIRSALADVPGATLTGLGVLSHDAEANVARQLPRLICVAMLTIAGYLLLHFRNLHDLILSVLPTIFSLICVLAFDRLCGARLNIINLVAFPLLIGIDVDYGVFLVSAARRKHRGVMSQDELLAQINPSFSAVILCATATVLGFASLLFTSIPAVHSLGLLVSVGILACGGAIALICVPAMCMGW